MEHAARPTDRFRSVSVELPRFLICPRSGFHASVSASIDPNVDAERKVSDAKIASRDKSIGSESPDRPARSAEPAAWSGVTVSGGVCHVTFGLEIGGLEKLLVQFARQAADDGLPVHVINLGHAGPIAEELNALNIPVRNLGQPAGLRPRLWWQLWRAFGELRPRVVHCHDVRTMIYAAVAARWARVPKRVHTQHGRNVGEKGRTRWLVRTASRCVTDLVAVSADIAKLTAAEGWRPQRTHVVRNGVRADRFAAVASSVAAPSDLSPVQSQVSEETAHAASASAKPWTIVIVARLSAEKGIDVAIDAAEVMLRTMGWDDFQMRIAGDGPLRTGLERQIAERGLEDHVRLLGAVRDVPSLLAAADVFLLPSRSEGVSLTLIEAMFAGVPIVATAVGGTPEVIQDGINGLLVPPESPEPMAEALQRLRSSESLREELVRQGQRIAQEEFSHESMAERYREIYGIATEASSTESTS